MDLSDSESEEAGTESADKEDAMGRRKGDLGVNKKGTPLYSREDIREQYCINDKELQVLDKTGRKGILGCFSNNGQVRNMFTHKKYPHCTVIENSIQIISNEEKMMASAPHSVQCCN